MWRHVATYGSLAVSYSRIQRTRKNDSVERRSLYRLISYGCLSRAKSRDGHLSLEISENIIVSPKQGVTSHCDDYPSVVTNLLVRGQRLHLVVMFLGCVPVTLSPRGSFVSKRAQVKVELWRSEPVEENLWQPRTRFFFFFWPKRGR